MKVSIIVPAYNAEATIVRCIDSILDQTLREIELIIIDDGSTDSTAQICAAYHDERLRYYRKENGGPSAARNQGVSLARGEYIGFVDADDYITPDMCEKMYEAGSKAIADICVCDYDIVWDTGKVTPYTDLLRGGYFDQQQIRDEVLSKFLGHITSNGNVAKIDWAIIRRFFRREFLERIALRFDETLSNSEDCLYTYIATHYAEHTVYLKNEKLYINIRNSHSLTRRYLPDYWQQRCRIMDELAAVIGTLVWETASFPLFVMRCIKPSFINIAYGFERNGMLYSLMEYRKIVNDPWVRKMCEVLDPAGLNEEWTKLFNWCKHRWFITLYLYHMDVIQHNKMCHFIRKVQKKLERGLKKLIR